MAIAGRWTNRWCLSGWRANCSSSPQPPRRGCRRRHQPWPQPRIVDAADVDSMIIFELTEGGNDCALTHSWTRSGDGPPALVRSARQLFPWSHAHARAGTLAGFASLDEITDAAERQTLEHYDMRSGVAVPFSIEGTPPVRSVYVGT